MTVGALVTAVPLFVGCFVLGLYAIPRAAPAHLMYAWDGVIVAFLFFWGIGLITELQRTEPLSLSKFLHLPVSANGAFLINYLSSLRAPEPDRLRAGDARVLAWRWSTSRGSSLLPVLPLLAAFLLMVTALTYQFQGWLASLMSNPRRRRTVIVVDDGGLHPDLPVAEPAELLRALGAATAGRPVHGLVEEMAKLNRAFRRRNSTPWSTCAGSRSSCEKHKLATQQADRESLERWEQAARLVNMVLPVGWLPLGVMSAAEGRVLPSILGLSGMTLIGTASLWRAYRTTVGQYQGQAHEPEGPAGAARPHRRRPPGSRASCCSKLVSPAYRNRSRPSRWGASARSCGRPRRR